MSRHSQNMITAYYWLAQSVLFAAILTAIRLKSMPVWLAAVTVFLCVTADILLMRMIFHLNEERKIADTMRQRQLLLQRQLSYFAMLRLRNTYVRRLYHDLSNHLIAIRELRANGQKEAADAYAEKVRQACRFDQKVCSSERINLAVSLYAMDCSRKHVTPQMSFQIPAAVSPAYEDAVTELMASLSKEGYAGSLHIEGSQAVMENRRISLPALPSEADVTTAAE